MGIRKTAILAILGAFISLWVPIAGAKNADDDLNFSRGAIQDGLYGIARSRLDQVLRRTPDGENADDALFLRGQALYFLDQIEAAEADFLNIIEQSKNEARLAEASYWLGECAYARGHFDAAAERYEATIRRFPKSPAKPLALFGLGWSYYELGDDVRAADAFKRIINEHSRHEIFGEAQLKFAECLYRMGNLDESGYAFRQFLKKQKESPLVSAAHFWLGEINYTLQRYDAARESYEASIESAGSSGRDAQAWLGQAYYGLAWAAYQEQDDEAALRHLDRFTEYFAKEQVLDSALFLQGIVLERLEKRPEAVKVFDDLTRRFPESAWSQRASFRKAVLQFKEGHQEDALATLLQMERQILPDTLAAHVRYFIGRIYFKIGDSDGAIRWLEKLVDQKTLDTEMMVSAQLLLGDAWARTEESQRALEAYDKVLNGFPQHPSVPLAQYRVGEVLYSLQKYDTAISAFRSLLVNFPKAPLRDRAQYKIGWCYFHLGDFETALKYFEKTVHQFPDSELAWDARLMKAEAAYNAGHFKDALDQFRKLRDAAPDHEHGQPQLDYGVAWTAWQLGDAELSRETFQSIVTSRPEHPLTADALFWLGQHYTEQGEWKEAQIAYKQITERFPRHALIDDALYGSGWAYYREGDVLSAADRFKELAARYGDSPLAADALFRTAQILVEQKRPKNAVDYYQKALKTAPESFRPEVQYNLARCHQEIGDHDQAILEYLKVVYLYPDVSEWAVKAHLQAAWLFEREQRWQEAEKIYVKIADTDGEEAAVAQNRLTWIEENIK